MKMWKQAKMVLVAAGLAAGIGIFASGCASEDRVHETAGEELNDATITSRVASALQASSDHKFNDVQVNTFKGSVQLSGFVASGSAKDQAFQVAERVDGVKDVINNITVK